MPDNNIYGVDFIARCMAAEALENGGGPGITVDDALSTTSENPVQNKVITNTLKTKPTSVAPDGTVLNDQKFMALTRQQYEAIQEKDPNTYYMITDDPIPSNINVRTAYVDETANIIETTLDGMTAFQIPVPADFEALDVSFNFSGRATSGEWTIGCDNYVHTFRVLPTDTKIKSSLQITMIEGHTSMSHSDLRMMGDVSSVRYFAKYDSTHNTVTIAISVPFLTQADATSVVDNTTDAAWTTLTMNNMGYVAYGPDNVVISDAFVAGDGITIDGTTISLTDAPAADVNASVSNSQLTIQLEDADGVPMGTGATVNLPNGLPASTSADEGKVLTVNASGNPEWDESTVNVFRTAYTSVLDDYTSSYDAGGNWILTFQPEVSFEKLDVYLQWHFDWGAGTDWPVRTATRSIMLSLTKDVAGPVVSPGMNIYLANSINNPNNSDTNLLYDILAGSINITYDDQTNTVTMLVAKPVMDAISDPGNDKNSLPVTMTNCVANAFGYVAYGNDNYVVYDGLTAGSGIDITNDVISFDGNEVPDVTSTDDGKVLTADYTGGVGSYSWESISTSDRTYYCECSTAASTAAKVVSTTQDFVLEKGAIIAVKFSNQNTATNVTLNVNNSGAKGIAVGATVPYTGDKPDRCGYGSGYLNYYIYNGTYWHAMGCSRAANEVPATNSTQNGRVLTNVQGVATWANLPSVDEVPDVGSTDDGKVLTASYSGGTGSYAWATPSGGSGLPAHTYGQLPIVGSGPVPGGGAADFTYLNASGNDSKFVCAFDEGGQYGTGFTLTSIRQVPRNFQPANVGKVLKCTSSGNDATYAWGDISLTDGTNYWIEVNGIRLYFASSAPTGTIPDGSLGIGW